MAGRAVVEDDQGEKGGGEHGIWREEKHGIGIRRLILFKKTIFRSLVVEKKLTKYLA